MVDAELKLYSGVTEYGTQLNPISFGVSTAGSIIPYSLNPLYLWNDKGGLLGSVTAKEISVEVLEMWIQDEVVGTSDGSPSQVYTTVLSPIYFEADETVEDITVTINGDVWSRVDNLIDHAFDAQVYELDPVTGTITFGDGVNGGIPPNGFDIYVTYMPELIEYGNEISYGNWLEIKSYGVTSNAVSVVDEMQTSSDTTHVTVANKNLLNATGVWLQSDPGHSGTNYFTGGSIDPMNGVVILGTVLPNANEPVLIDYSYTIIDDLEAVYTPIGEELYHQFENAIPKNNAKLLYLQLNVPSTATSSGGSQVSFRLRLTYKQ